LGSVYIRKVHFRDVGMIHQIEEKVVNRLRQVTSAIRQAGSNQVSVITSSAEREAAIEFAKAAAIRPATLGQAFQEIAREPEVAAALFDQSHGCGKTGVGGGGPPRAGAGFDFTFSTALVQPPLKSRGPSSDRSLADGADRRRTGMGEGRGIR
jgi:hypothetical protein